ncbi:MAG: alpha/beta hydrolase [Thermoflexales bacterium]
MFISVGDAKIYATSFGPVGRPAVLGVGGWTGSWELWAEPFSILSQRWRTIAYDHRGAGVTRAPVESITHDRLIDDVFAVMDAYQVERGVLAAESAGALTALGAALRHPARIAGLVLVDAMFYRAPMAQESPFVIGLRTAYAETLGRFVAACVPEPDSEHLRAWGIKILSRATSAEAIALFNAATGVDLRGDLARITQPVLIFHGERDVIVPLDQARELTAALPHAKLTVISGAGHVPSVTRPEEIAVGMADFLEAVYHAAAV